MNGGVVISGPITTSQTIWVFDANGTCTDEISFNVTIDSLPSITSMSGGGVYCEGAIIDDVMIDVTGIADWTINYTLEGIAQTITSSSSPISLGNTPGVYILIDITDNACSNTATGTETIIINPIPSAPIAGTDATYCSSITPADLTASGSGGEFTWYDDANSVIGTGSSFTPFSTVGITNYYVIETSTFGCIGPSSMVTITINECELVIPTAITPGASPNEVWEIINLDAAYPNSLVTIYNRWGNLIFEKESDPNNPYSLNPWNGTYNGEPLPVASYYFIIQFNDGSGEAETGTVTIINND